MNLSGAQHQERATLQHAARELFELLDPVAKRHPQWARAGVVDRFVEPERQIVFRVTWINDRGEVQVNRGYRVQFNSAMGPYFGGLLFDPAVTLDSLKVAALEQTLQNALTGLAIGGAKGGSDFDRRGKSESEVMRFCQAFMSELCRHIGDEVDIATDDGGTDEREIGFMYGQYRKMTRHVTGALTGKGLTWGGTYFRFRARGFGIGYFIEAMLKARGTSLEGATLVVSGSGHDAIYSNKKPEMLGARIVAMSDPDGYIHDPQGIVYDAVKELTIVGKKPISDYLTKRPQARYIEGCDGIWSIPCDIAIACGGPDEIDGQAAATLVQNGCHTVVEGAQRACTPEAIELFRRKNVTFAPAVAAAAGAAVVSAFELSQNSARSRWEWSEVDNRLRQTMGRIHAGATAAAKEYGRGDDLLAGAKIAAFLNLAEAMYEQGVV